MKRNSMWGLIILFFLLVLTVVVGAYVVSVGDEFEVRRLLFASGVLAVLAFILVIGIAIYGMPQLDSTGTPVQNPAAKEIFDKLTTGILPVITLVLGFYFGQSPPSQHGAPKKDSSQVAGDSATKSGNAKSAPSPTKGGNTPTGQVPDQRNTGDSASK